MIRLIANNEWVVIDRFATINSHCVAIDPVNAFVTPVGFCVPLNNDGRAIHKYMCGEYSVEDMSKYWYAGEYPEALIIDHFGNISIVCWNSAKKFQYLPITSPRWVGFNVYGQTLDERDIFAAFDFLVGDSKDVIEAVSRVENVVPQGMFDPFYFKVADIAEYLSKNGITKQLMVGHYEMNCVIHPSK